jgi:hypothetical protein
MAPAAACRQLQAGGRYSPGTREAGSRYTPGPVCLAQSGVSTNQVTIRPPRRRQPHLAARAATSPSPRPPSASPPAGRSRGTPGPAAVGDLDPDQAVPVRHRDRDRPPGSPRAAVPDAVAEQLAHQQDRGILARVPRAEHPACEGAGNPRPLRQPRQRHALPHRRPAHQPTVLPARPARRSTGNGSGHGRMHAQLSPGRQAAPGPCAGAAGRNMCSNAARPWPSVEKPTVRTDRPNCAHRPP